MFEISYLLKSKANPRRSTLRENFRVQQKDLERVGVGTGLCLHAHHQKINQILVKIRISKSWY